VTFFRGIRAFFTGVAFVFGTPSVWGYAIVPVALALVLTVALSALGLWGAAHVAHAVVGADAGALGTMVVWLIEIALGLVAILTALLVAFALAQPLSGFALDVITRRQARALGAPEPPPQRGSSFFRSLRVTFAALAVAVPLLALLALITILFPPAAVVTLPLKLAVSALTLAWDLLDYPLSQLGLGVRDRLRWMRARFGAVMGFGIAGSFVLLVPGLGLLMLPMGVAGATALTVDDARRALRP
jgi:CysZ protein